MQDIKIGNTIPRGVCGLNQHYGVQKNHQLLRTSEALKIMEAVYSTGVIFVLLILIIIILTNLEMCCVWSLLQPIDITPLPCGLGVLVAVYFVL